MKENVNNKSVIFSRWILLAFVFLLPVLFLPTNILSFSATKVILVTVATLSVLLIWIISKLRDEDLVLPFNFFTLSIIFIPISYIISSLFSSSFNASFFGRELMYDNALFTLILFILMGLFVSLFRDIKDNFNLYSVIFVSFLISVLFLFVNLFFPEILSRFQFFFSNTINTVGKWNDFGVFAGVIMFISIIGIEILKPSNFLKKILYFFFGLSLFVMVFIGFKLLWVISLVISLMIFVFLLTFNRINSQNNKFPYTALASFILSFVFIFGQGLISDFINNKFQLYNSETRISIQETMRLSKENFLNNPIVGYGPGQFINAWSMLKKPEFNLLEEWSIDFKFANGYLMQAFIDLGLIGLMSWILFFVLYLYYGVKNLFKNSKDSTLKFFGISSFISSLYLWILNIFYVPSVTTFTLTFVLTGIFISTLYLNKDLADKKINLSKSPKSSFAYVFILVLFILGSISVFYNYTERFIADHYLLRANVAYGQNNIVDAGKFLEKSLEFNSNDLVQTDYAFILERNINSVLQNQNISEEEKGQVLRNYLEASVQTRNNAIMYDRKNYKNHLNLGDLYSSLIQFQIAGSYEEALKAYKEAMNLSPNNPLILLSMARLEISNKNLTEAKNILVKALELKPNYVDAIFLYSQIQIAEGDFDSAIKTAENAILTRPFDPAVYFQVGLLRYQNNQFAESIPYFEGAVIRNPLFLNAKYFLGLAYERTGRNNDAILQFEDLDQILKDNKEIKDLLEKIKSGQSIFEQQVNSEIEIDEELPIDEDSKQTE